jgi:hypothetical protein
MNADWKVISPQRRRGTEKVVKQVLMRIIYSLKEDKTRIDNVQKATLRTAEFGIEPSHGLFGSPEWWQKIASGELPVRTCRGVITRRYVGGMNDWPEFAMRCESGEETNWSRYGRSVADDRFYQPGRRVEVDYVLQRHRVKGSSHEAEYRVVLEVRIEVPPETIRERIIRQRTTGNAF